MTTPITMNFFEAAVIVDAIINETECADLWDHPGHIITALNILDEDGSDDDRRSVERVFDRAPGLINYDEGGNWIGEVANENGITNH